MDLTSKTKHNMGKFILKKNKFQAYHFNWFLKSVYKIREAKIQGFSFRMIISLFLEFYFIISFFKGLV